MIAYSPENIKEALIEIYDSSLTEIEKLIFIPKPGRDCPKVENYRPITLLEIAGKILEKIINNKLIKQLEENN